ncbi:MAG: hypothetical protein ACI81R_003474 [Bradymonadia bacterium]
MNKHASLGTPRAQPSRTRHALAALAATLLALGAGLIFAWPVVNSVETGQSEDYPSLQPVTYPVSEERAVAAVRDAISDMHRWELHDDVSEATLRGAPAISLSAAATAWGLLPDSEVVVMLAPHGEGGTLASVRSSTPHVRGDLGQNARNVRSLLSAIDTALLR